MVYRLSPAGQETVLYSFTGGNDGGFPAGTLTLGAGHLYGASAAGGINGSCGGLGCGVVFEVTGLGKETVLYTFTGGTDGANPSGALLRDSAGNLYGTTLYGGDLSCNSPNGCGVVFKLDPAGVETVLYSFIGGSDGAFPRPGLALDIQGNLYGSTSEGGMNSRCFGLGCGVVFNVDPLGNETVLYTFSGGQDGAGPEGGLVRDSAGDIYGETGGGGNLSNCASQGCGVIFKLTAAGTQTVLYTFTGGRDGWAPSFGLLPYGGQLYGTTFQGGISTGSCGLLDGCGAVFKFKLF